MRPRECAVGASTWQHLRQVARERIARNAVGQYGSARYSARAPAFSREFRWYRGFFRPESIGLGAFLFLKGVKNGKRITKGL